MLGHEITTKMFGHFQASNFLYRPRDVQKLLRH